MTDNKLKIIMEKRDTVSINQDPFKEYIKQTEPDKRYKGYVWSKAEAKENIGLPQNDKRF